MDWSCILLVIVYVVLALNLIAWMIKYMRLKRRHDAALNLIDTYDRFLKSLWSGLEAKDSDEK